MKLTITEKLNRNDFFFTAYKSENGFVQAVKEIEENTERISLPVVSLEVYGTNEKDKAAVAEKLCVDEADAVDIIKTGLAYKVNDNFIPARESSLTTFEDRLKISGQALVKISKENLAFILNKCREITNEDALVVKIGNKISAVLSDGYSVIPSDEVFKAARKRISKIGGCFKKGFVSHDIVNAEYSIENKELTKKYADVLQNGVAVNINLSVVVETSNIGLSAVNAYPMYTKIGFGGREVSYIIGSPISIEHRGSANIEKVNESFNGIFAMFEKSIEKLQELKNKKIKYPTQAFLNAAKTLGLNKKYVMQAFSDFISLGVSADNVYDVYAGLTEALFYAKEDNKDSILISNMTENLARALTMNWDTVDVPTSSWLTIEVVKKDNDDENGISA